MAKVFDIMLRLSAVNNMSTTINKAVDSGVRKLDELKKKTSAIANSAKSFATTTAIAGGVMAAALAVPINTAADFQHSMARTGAIAGANNEQFKTLTNTAREMGKTTMFTATESAKAMQFLAMAGFKTNEIVGALPQTLNLAAAGAIELSDAADISSNILSGFGKKASDLGKINDILVNTFTKSNVDLRMLGETMKYVAPIAKNLNIPINQVAAMAGKLGDAGIQGTMAGTAMRQSFLRLASPTSQAQEILSNLGITVKDAAGNMRPIMSILDDINTKTAKMGNVDKAGVIKQIFGLESASAITQLLSKAGSGELQNFADIITKSGAASAVAAKQMNTFTGQKMIFNSAVQDLSITIGNQLLPTLTVLAKDFTKVIGHISAFAEKNPLLTRTLVTATAALSALLVVASGAGFAVMGIMNLWTGIITIAPFLVTAFGTISGAIGTMTTFMLANPILLIITAIAVSALLIYKYWDPISNFFIGIWDSVKSAFDKGFLNGIIKVFETFNPMAILIKMASNIIDYLFGVNLYDAGVNIMKGLWDGMASMSNKVVAFGANLGHSISTSFKNVLGIKSPSRVFMSHGMNIAKGAEIGMNKGGLGTSNSSSITNTSLKSSSNSFSSSNGKVEINYSPNITIEGGSASSKADFMKMLDENKNELLRLISDMFDDQKRIAY